MYKKIGSIVGILAVLAALLFVPGSAEAANLSVFVGLTGAPSDVDAGTAYTAWAQINNNTGSPITAKARITFPQGLFRTGSTTSTGLTGVSCTTSGFRLIDCSYTIAGFSTGYLNTPVVGRACYPSTGFLWVTAYTGTWPGTFIQSYSQGIAGGSGRVTCTLNTNPPSGYNVITAESRNTNYYEEVYFTIGYGSATTGYLEAGITNSGKATFNTWSNGADKIDLWVDPGSVFIQDCPSGGGHTFGDCNYTGWQSTKTGIVGADYHVGNTAGSDKKFYRFFTGTAPSGTMQFEELVDVTVT